MADSLSFDVIAIDKASEVFKKIGSESEGLSGKLGTVAKVAGAAFAGIGVAILKTGFDELKDAQAGAAQLAAGIKSTGDASGTSVAQLEKLATSIQNYSGQTDDSIVKSEQLLLTFTNIKDAAGANNDIFDQTVKISADMAAKMGGDASASAIQLGKALNDPVKGITALQRVGVSFTDAQKAQIAAMVKTGNTVGAQKVILAELNKEFGGSAKAAGETLPGQLARAKRSFEDVSQSIVEKLLPVITKTFSFIENNMGWIGPLAVGLAAIAAVIVTVNLATKAWTAAQAALNVVMDANPIALVVIAIAALVAGFVIAYKKSETFRDIVKGALDVVKDAAKAVADFFTKDIPAAFEAVITWGKKNWPLIVGILTGPIGLAVEQIVVHRDQIIGFFKEVPGKLVSALATVGEAILSPFRAAFNAIANLWNGTVGQISFHIPGWVPGVGGKGFSVPKIPTFGGGSSAPSPGTGGATGGVKARARGGAVNANEPYIVGENQPELFIPSTSGRIMPSVPNGPGGGDTYITLTLDGQVLHRAMIPYAQRYKNRNGNTGLS